MKLTKRQLKRIIREEYSRLKRRGLIKEEYEESFEPFEFGSTYDTSSATADTAYEDGFDGYHEGRDEPGHHYKGFEDDWYAGWNDGKASPAGDYDPNPKAYDTNPRWEDSRRGEPRRN